jgi:hypothetical protein
MKTNSKLIALVICVLCSISAYAEHLSFLGIPLDGTIENFDKQIKNKGFVSSVDFSSLNTNNQKWYDGKFANQDVVVLISSTYKSNKVYSAAVTLFCDSDSDMYTNFTSWKDRVSRKYNVTPIQKDSELYYYVEDKGMIVLRYDYDPDQPLLDFQYQVQLLYMDLENNNLADKEAMDDF